MDHPRPPKPGAERCQAGASLGGDHHTPLAQSAKADPPPSLLSERRPDAADNIAERCQARASLGGKHPTPSRKARKPTQSLLSERRPDAAEPRPPKPERSGVRPERALEANTQPPRAQRES